MGTVLWFIGFALMMASFAFLLGNDEPQQPRISVDPWWPDAEQREEEQRKRRQPARPEARG